MYIKKFNFLMLLTCVKLSLTVWPFYALKTDKLLLPILKQIPMPTTQESVVRSSSNVKVKGGTRKKVIAKCLILTRDKALKELTTRPSYITDVRVHIRWPTTVDCQMIIFAEIWFSLMWKNTIIFRGPVDLRFESNKSLLRYRHSDSFSHNRRWAAESIS